MLFQKITFLIVRSTSSPPFFFFPFYDVNLLSVGDTHVAGVLMQLVVGFGLHQTRAILYIYKIVFLYVYDGLALLHRLYREQYWLTP